jgi:hypothetical protein
MCFVLVLFDVLKNGIDPAEYSTLMREAEIFCRGLILSYILILVRISLYYKMAPVKCLI